MPQWDTDLEELQKPFPATLELQILLQSPGCYVTPLGPLLRRIPEVSKHEQVAAYLHGLALPSPRCCQNVEGKEDVGQSKLAQLSSAVVSVVMAMVEDEFRQRVCAQVCREWRRVAVQNATTTPRSLSSSPPCTSLKAPIRAAKATRQQRSFFECGCYPCSHLML